EQNLLMLHVDHIDRADASWKIKNFVLGERFSGKPAFAFFVDDRRIQTLLDRRPDRKVRSELITVDGDVRTIPDANFIDLVEEKIMRIPREYIGHTRLHAKAYQRKVSRALPIPGFLKLVISQFDSGLVERVLRVRLRQGHRHIHISD